MIQSEKVIVLDIDGTLCPIKSKEADYADLIPFSAMVDKLRDYQTHGFYIILYSSRNMNTFQGNKSLLQSQTLPVLMDWLSKHQIPYNEIHLGKPWAGVNGFYVDDRAIRPDEFLKLSYAEILKLTHHE